MGTENVDTSALTSEEEGLLRKIVEKGLRLIRPKIDIKGISYEDLEDILKVEHGGWQRYQYMFENLAERGILIPRDHVRVLFCPKCGSPHVYSRYACPKCQSPDVANIRLIEHQLCGYTWMIDDSRSRSNIVCPNCEADLGPYYRGPVGDDSYGDYKIIGSSYECTNCGNRFDRPNIMHECQNCGTIFDYRNSRYEKLHDYEIPSEIIKKIKVREEIIVLVIEDNLDEAEIINRSFAYEKNFKVEHVDTGRKALNRLDKKDYDVILLDFLLPDMNALSILNKMKEKGIDTPVIIFTGADDREKAVSTMKLGAIDYLVKSVEMYEQLPLIIKKIMKI
jgi:CheY-like chemotaxis protein